LGEVTKDGEKGKKRGGKVYSRPPSTWRRKNLGRVIPSDPPASGDYVRRGLGKDRISRRGSRKKVWGWDVGRCKKRTPREGGGGLVSLMRRLLLKTVRGIHLRTTERRNQLREVALGDRSLTNIAFLVVDSLLGGVKAPHPLREWTDVEKKKKT